MCNSLQDHHRYPEGLDGQHALTKSLEGMRTEMSPKRSVRGLTG